MQGRCGALFAPKGRAVRTRPRLAPLVVVPLVYLALADVRQGALFGVVTRRSSPPFAVAPARG